MYSKLAVFLPAIAANLTAAGSFLEKQQQAKTSLGAPASPAKMKLFEASSGGSPLNLAQYHLGAKTSDISAPAATPKVLQFHFEPGRRHSKKHDDF